MVHLDPKFDLGAIEKSFSDGLLFELQRALRSTLRGELFALVSREPTVRDDLDRWARLTENSIVEVSEEPAGTRYVIRNGPAPPSESPPLGERLWLYSNFDCNLACDYCCVRSSPKTARRALPLETILRISSEAPALGVREIFVTGGEPLLLDEIAQILTACARAAPTTVLTNGIPLAGRRLRELADLDRRRTIFQISIDSPTPERHDAHRGPGSWERAMRGVRAARAEGFRVRLAATVEDDVQARELIEFFDRERVLPEDRVIRPIARRGLAETGVAVVRADLLPEITITAEGVYWHPVGADDRDLFVTSDILPLARAFDAVRQSFEREHALVTRLLSTFHCA
jgi:sulfatase maturation enzyme AslB (radical SAM superfamily)